MADRLQDNPEWMNPKERDLFERKRILREALATYMPYSMIVETYSQRFHCSESAIRQYIAEIRKEWRQEITEAGEEQEKDRALKAREFFIANCLGKDNSQDRGNALRAMDSLAKIMGWVDRPGPAEGKVTVVFHRPEKTDDPGDDLDED